MIPPNDLPTEEALLGALMLNNLGIEVVKNFLTPTDFYRPAHGVAYEAILDLHAHGQPVDAITVRDALIRSGSPEVLSKSDLLQITYNAGPVTSVRHYAEIVLDRSLRRRMVLEGMALAEHAADLGNDAGATLEEHQALVSTMGSTVIDREPDDISIEEFLARPRNEIAPWVVHGLIRRRHKIMIVGGEGAGKSWVLRFVALCAAYGIQPFRHTKIRPVRTLIVDLENPEDALFDSFEAILKQVSGFSPQTETHARLWWRPAGINLRNRVDVAELENVIRTRRPDLVCLGPLYASYENTSKDFGWETAAREVQTVLKSLMVRYNFGLLIEDHAPQSDGGKRDMRPYGSSMWRRWPDVGIGMEPVEGRDDSFRLTRWRGDRVPTDWPTWITRGSASKSLWPFLGTWEDETFGAR
jgi:DnaB-like helicase N terminal domain/AAA domain